MFAVMFWPFDLIIGTLTIFYLNSLLQIASQWLAI